MDDKGKSTSLDNNGDAGNSVSSSGRGIVMHKKKQFFFHIISVLSLAFTFFMAVYLLAQNKSLNQVNNKLSQEIKAQTDINQRYLRCILLIEREKFANVESRVDAIDKCAVESKTPNGNDTGTQPTSQDQKDFEAEPKQSMAPVPTDQSNSPPPGGSTNPTQASPPQTQTATSDPPKTPLQQVVEATKPIREVLGL